MTAALLPGEVPAGITFGRRALLIPAVSDAFRHSGDLTGLRSNHPYTWVSRGDPIGSYRISVPKTDIPLFSMLVNETVHEVQIPSPASGLVIYSSYNFENDKHDFSRIEDPSAFYRMTLLLPDDEPPAENGEYMFSVLCQCCWRNRSPFLKPSRSWTWGAFTESGLRECLDDQLQLKPRYVDVMPRFERYLQDARTRYPHLRPHLRHLL